MVNVCNGGSGVKGSGSSGYFCGGGGMWLNELGSLMVGRFLLLCSLVTGEYNPFRRQMFNSTVQGNEVSSSMNGGSGNSDSGNAVGVTFGIQLGNFGGGGGILSFFNPGEVVHQVRHLAHDHECNDATTYAGILLGSGFTFQWQSCPCVHECWK